MPFRYSVEANSKVTCFEPKAVPTNYDKLDSRPSLFGATFLSWPNGLDTLPNSETCKCVWEAA